MCPTLKIKWQITACKTLEQEAIPYTGKPGACKGMGQDGRGAGKSQWSQFCSRRGWLSEGKHASLVTSVGQAEGPSENSFGQAQWPKQSPPEHPRPWQKTETLWTSQLSITESNHTLSPRACQILTSVSSGLTLFTGTKCRNPELL